jgi:hypothetical protein
LEAIMTTELIIFISVPGPERDELEAAVRMARSFLEGTTAISTIASYAAERTSRRQETARFLVVDVKSPHVGATAKALETAIRAKLSADGVAGSEARVFVGRTDQASADQA